MSIALRFIPTLMDELDKIILAQKSRGSEISSGNIATRIKSFIPLLVPLFISAFQRAEEVPQWKLGVMMPMLRERATDSLNGN